MFCAYQGLTSYALRQLILKRMHIRHTHGASILKHARGTLRVAEASSMSNRDKNNKPAPCTRNQPA
jgi:hypothetical protein